MKEGSKIKAKDGAEKKRGRRKRRMMDEAKSCKTLTNMFSKISENEKNSFDI